jgi:mRNA-degrading endonuclease RelE of RelBE toxin-antitoxin system
MAKRIVWTEQAKADVRAIEATDRIASAQDACSFAGKGQGDTRQGQDVDPPLFRLRAQDYRIFYRDKGDVIEITRVSNRKEAYR